MHAPVGQHGVPAGRKHLLQESRLLISHPTHAPTCGRALARLAAAASWAASARASALLWSRTPLASCMTGLQQEQQLLGRFSQANKCRKCRGVLCTLPATCMQQMPVGMAAHQRTSSHAIWMYQHTTHSNPPPAILSSPVLAAGIAAAAVLCSRRCRARAFAHVHHRQASALQAVTWPRGALNGDHLFNNREQCACF